MSALAEDPRVYAAISDAFYNARNSGRTMTDAATDATAAVEAIFAADIDKLRETAGVLTVALATLRAGIEGLLDDGMTDAGDCCSDYCVATVHDLRLDQAERLQEVLQALLAGETIQ